MAGLTLRTLGSRATLGPIIQVTGLTSYLINSAVGQAEAGQPEGQRIQLTLPGLAVAGQGMAAQAANALQAQFLVGAVKDPASGHPIIPWPEQPSVLAAATGPATLQIRWVKGQWEVLIVIGLLAGIFLTYEFLQALHGSDYALQTVSAAGSGSGFPWFGGSPFRVFGVPWYDALPIAAGLVAVPWVLTQVARTEGGAAAVLTESHAVQRAERERS